MIFSVCGWEPHKVCEVSLIDVMCEKYKCDKRKTPEKELCTIHFIQERKQNEL